MLWFNFILGLNFLFFCFWVWKYNYDNEFETKANKIQTKDKIEPQHIKYAKLNLTISVQIHPQVLGTEALGTSLHQRDHLVNSDPVFHLFFGWRGSGTGRDANFGLYYHNLKNSKKQKINVCLST